MGWRAQRPGATATVRLLHQRAGDSRPEHLFRDRARPNQTDRGHHRGPDVGSGSFMTALDAHVWTELCRFDALTPERGVAALVGDLQLAVFRTFDDSLYAIDNIDPFSGAAVLSRGIVGDRGGEP